jgi:hypothetical protein
MATFKIKLEDKAAFLNRMEKQGEAIGSEQIKDNKLEGYFEVTIDNPEQLEVTKAILNKSPKINTIKEMKKKLTKTELSEMVRQELQAVLAEKKKVKKEDEKEKLDEAMQPELIAGITALVATGGALLIPFLNDVRKVGLKQAAQNLANSLSSTRGDV